MRFFRPIAVMEMRICATGRDINKRNINDARLFLHKLIIQIQCSVHVDFTVIPDDHLPLAAITVSRDTYRW